MVFRRLFSNKWLWLAIPLALVALYAGLAGSGYTAFGFNRAGGPDGAVAQGIDTLVAGSPEQFEFLSNQRSSTCSLQRETVQSYSDDARIQGSCCSRMDLHRYQEQVEGLRQYAHIPQIPSDPYDIPVSLAKELFEYQETIQLTPEQQAVYDQAMEMADEGGPCCCRCWRWIAFEGQAKFLITRHNFTAVQIAQVWDLEDGCGGAGHTEGGEHDG